jgi:RHS repeat-associated protein
MRLRNWKRILIPAVFGTFFFAAGAQAAPTITSLTPNSGAVGASVTIAGSNFGTSQDTVTFNGTTAAVTTWSSSSIAVTVPSGATSGNVVVTVSGQASNGVNFTVVPTPQITSLSPNSSAVSAEIAIAGSNFGATQGSGSVTFNGTSATPTSWSASTISVPVPSGATSGNVVVNASGVASNSVSFTVVPTPNISGLSVTSGVVGTSVTITGTNFGSTQGSGTVSFNGTDATPTSWSASSIAVPVPAAATTGNVVVSASGVPSNGINFTVVEGLAITAVSPTSGVVGEQVTITGTGFGATQGGSTISLNGTNVVVASWSDTSIVGFVPSGASSGPFSVTVNSQAVNSVSFTVTKLPSGWSDGDVGSVGIAGSATYGNDTFTVKGSGISIRTNSDTMHFVYQPLSGDGTIIARVVSATGSNYPQAAVMIRETLDPASKSAFMDYYSSGAHFSYRSTSGASASTSGSISGISLPYWLKLIRSNGTFYSYASSDGVNWTQVGTSQSFTMAQNVYIGLAVCAQDIYNSTLDTATLDNVSVSPSATPAPAITAVSATTGSIGSQVTITGAGFGSTQNGSVLTLNSAAVPINSWSATSIVITIPAGATSGNLVVSVAPSMNDSNPVYFAVTPQPLPSSWQDRDVGAVGVTGSATFANGTFTAKGSGTRTTYGTYDQMHFIYQPLLGDGTIVARVVSTAGSTYPQAGVMIRETLDTASTNALVQYWSSSVSFWDRPTTGGSTTNQAGGSVTLPYWLKLVRSGNTFSGYSSYNGMTWTQIGTSQTITMAQNVYIGLAVSSYVNTTLSTVTFDEVSISTPSTPPPTITNVSATTGSVGSQVEINGSGFGATQGNSLVSLNNVPLIVNSWEDASIQVTIPAGAISGYFVVSVAPSMNSSNPVFFTVTSQPLTSTWLDQDVGQVGFAGSATYTNGTFTVKGSGTNTTYGASDQMHFVYQPLSGDGTIVARVVSATGSTYPQAGVMIRETLDPASTNALVQYWSSATSFWDRPTTGGSTTHQTASSVTLPYWVKLVRSGNTFSGYSSYNGMTWTQIGTSQTITMAQNVYIGLAVCSYSNASLATATFDNVSISSTAAPAPVITSVSASTGSIGSQVLITGSGFGTSQGGSLVTLNNVATTVNSWTNSSIIISIPTGSTSGFLVVSVAPTMNASNAVFFTITAQPLSSPWLDQDVGPVGIAGSATYTNGTFTVQGSGIQISANSDTMHFVYQPLSGDGTIIARVVTATGSTYARAAVMIRETLDPASKSAFVDYSSSAVHFLYRASTGASASLSGYNTGMSLPYWLKLIRSGSSFYSYASADGVNWTQIGPSQSVTMAQNVYVGLVMCAGDMYNSTLDTATFDNVSLTIGTTPVVTGTSPSLGAVGSSVTITGSGFGTTQGTSTLTFNGITATSISSWSSTQIIATVPSAAPAGTGPVVVTVGPNTSPSTVAFDVIKPAITSIAPPAAQTFSYITLTGTGFGTSQDSRFVSFAGAAAHAFVQSWSDTVIQAQVPSDATNGPVTVTVDGVTSNSAQFTVLEALSLTGISPNSGPIGSSITISGAGFGATQSNSTVGFYGGAATVTSWSDTQIVATVPAGITSGPVTITVGGKSNWPQGPWFTLTTTVNLTDSLGNPTTYTSAVIGGGWKPTSAQGSGCSSCTVRGTVQSTYDSLGNVLSKTDELGRTTTYTYDSFGNVTSVSVPIAPGAVAATTYTYNNFGEVLTTTDPMGNVTANAYDSHGNLLTVTSSRPNGTSAASVTQFAYDTKGELTQITDPLNNKTTLTYFSTGLINTITDAQNNVTTYGYDAHGNRTSVQDANNQTATFAYDSGDRLKTVTYPGSTGTTTFTYDNRGRRTSVTDQNSKTTAYAYDDADRLTTVTDAANNVTTYGYDTENNLTSIQDANSHTTTFAYDAFGRVTRTTFPSTLSEYYYYDAVGNLITKTDRKNQTLNYTYDQLNRLTQKAYPDSSVVNYTYDNDSRLTQVTDPTGTYQFTFDNMGRLTAATTQYTFLTGRNFTTSYSYDAASNRTGFTDPESGSTSYVYDTLNRLQTLTPPAAFTATGNFGFSYDALSRRTQMTRPNGLTSNYTYDNLSRLLSVLHQSGSSILDGASYTVDNTGNRTSKTDKQANLTSNYTYDPLYQLTQVSQSATTTESYSYDPVGNRLSSLGVSSYTTNTSNELTATSNAAYTYDYNGNTQTKTDSTGTTTYTWDFENRLISVALPGTGGAVSFKYDPFGRRVYKSSSSATSIYAYDDRGNLIEETSATGAVVARYSQGLNIDEPLAMLRASTTSYYQADGLGSITSLSNGAGALAQTYSFDSFGKTTPTGSLVNPFQYTSRELDTETNLYFYRARYYDPSAGRFLSEDPSATSGRENLFQYVGNNPLNLYDPSGLSQTKPKQTQPGSNAVFFICCKGGQIAVCDKNSGAYGNGWVLDCMRQHEKQHIKDMTCGGKTPCKDQPDGPIQVPQSTARELECAAYRKELECLAPAPGNTKEIGDRKKFVQKQIDNYCGGK